MADALYDYGKQGMAVAEIDVDTAVLKCALVRGYTPNLSSHKFISDLVAAGGTLAGSSGTTPVAVTITTTTAGVIKGSNVTFTACGGTGTTGVSHPYVVVYQASAVTGGADVATNAQRLIALYDKTGTPITPNGGDIQIQWNASGLFAI